MTRPTIHTLWLGLFGCSTIDPEVLPPTGAARFSEVRVHHVPFEPAPFVDDWLELENPTDQPMDLTGHHLTEDLLVPQMWRFPDGTRLEPGERLVVLTRNSSATSEAAGFLGVDFQFDRDGESLHLFPPDELSEPMDSVIWRDAPDQFSTPVWARHPDDDQIWVWTTIATPGEPNLIDPPDTAEPWG